MYWIRMSRSAHIMLTGAFSTICMIRVSSTCLPRFEALSEASWAIVRSASSRVGLTSTASIAKKSMVPMTWPSRKIGRAIPRSDPGPARQGGAAAIAKLAQVLDEEQLALPPGPAVEPFPFAEPRGTRMPLKLVVDPPRIEREDQGVLRGIDRPVGGIGPAEGLANRVQRAADDVVDRVGPDDGVGRLDHGPRVGGGIRQQRFPVVVAVEQGRGCGSPRTGRRHGLPHLPDAGRGRGFSCGAAPRDLPDASAVGSRGRLALGGSGIVTGLGASGSMEMLGT